MDVWGEVNVTTTTTQFKYVTTNNYVTTIKTGIVSKTLLVILLSYLTLNLSNPGNYKCIVTKDDKVSQGVFEVILPIVEEDLIEAKESPVEFIEGQWVWSQMRVHCSYWINVSY